jgi:hypothetical protein
LSSNTSIKNKYLKTDCIDFFGCLDTDTVTNWYATELEPIINKVTELRLGNEGYAKNPFCPINPINQFANQNAINKDSLRIELKKKLNEPNFGLRSIREE